MTPDSLTPAELREWAQSTGLYDPKDRVTAEDWRLWLKAYRALTVTRTDMTATQKEVSHVR